MSWNEYDDQDPNLVTWWLPGVHANDDEVDNDQEGEDSDESA